jgi:anti-sigma B factor antagonist
MEPFFTTTQDGMHTLVQFQTESLMSTGDLERIGKSLNRLVDEEHRQSVLLDFTKVRYLSSQAIGMIIGLQKKLSQSQGSLELSGVSPQLMQLLKITKLDRIFKIRA